MQLTNMALARAFPLLLAILILFSGAYVQAVPIRRAAPITLSLRRVPQNRGDVHPLVYMQQHLNRAHRRHALFTKRTPPSEEQLRANIRKRVVQAAEMDATMRRRELEARYNRHGMPGYDAEADVLKSAGEEGGLDGLAALLGAEAGKASKSGTAAPAPSSSATSSSSSSDLSPLDIQALEDPAELTPALPPTANDSLGLAIEGADVGYIATIQIGTPPKSFNILMDSGSADFWVGSAVGCESQGGGGCGNHTFLGSATSSTFVNSTSQFSVTYGSGQVEGTLCEDTVAIAGLSLANHEFGTASVESADFASDETPFDGLMGLAQQALSQQKVPTPPEALFAAGLIPALITSFHIPRLADGPQAQDGEVTFGALDSSKFNSATLVSVANVNQEGFWEADVTAFTVNGENAGLQGRTAILDTGTTLIVAPPDDATAVHQLISGAQALSGGMFAVPCNTNASVALTVGGRSFAIEPKDLVVEPLNGDGDLCLSGIGSGEVGGAQEWLVGDVFLKNVYFSVDETKNQVSLAELA